MDIRCLPVFHGFSRAPHYLGPFGNGSKMKYVANLLVAIHTAAAGEAFAMARKVGLDPAQMFEVVADGAGGSRALQVRGEMLIADNYTQIRTMPLELSAQGHADHCRLCQLHDLPDADVLRGSASIQRSCCLGLRGSGHSSRLRRPRKDGRADVTMDIDRRRRGGSATLTRSERSFVSSRRHQSSAPQSADRWRLRVGW